MAMDNNANGLIDLKSVMPNEVAETLPGILSSESKSPSEVGENHPQLDTGVVTTLNETNGENSKAKMQAEERSPSMTEPSVVKSESTKHRRAGRKGLFRLRHFQGGAFLLPWGACGTWKASHLQWSARAKLTLCRGLVDAIKGTYTEPEDQSAVENGKFDLFDPRDSLISHHFWEYVAMVPLKSWQINVRLHSQDAYSTSNSHNIDPKVASVAPKSEVVKQEEETVAEPKSEAKVNYRLDFYHTSLFSDGELICTINKDHPTVVDYTDIQNPESLKSVVEERKTIQFQNKDRLLTKADILKNYARLPIAASTVITKLHIPKNLLNVLRSIIKYYSMTDIEDTATLIEGIFPHPYRDLFYHIQELQDYKTEKTGPRQYHTDEYNAESDRQIDVLTEYLDREPLVQFKSVQAKRGNKFPSTTFAQLWLLMKPATDVYVLEDGQLNGYVIHDIEGGVVYSRSVNAVAYRIRVWNLVYDGDVLQRMVKRITLHPFDGEREIMSLPVFPAHIKDNEDGGQRRKELVRRGMKYWKYSHHPAFLEYSGVGAVPPGKKYNRVRVIVEHKSKPWEHSLVHMHDKNIVRMDDVTIFPLSRAPRCECRVCTDFESTKEKYLHTTFSDYDDIDPANAPEITEHQAFLCMRFMYAFILKERLYDLLDVDGLDEPKFAPNSIDQLVMKDKYKETIKAIVKTYTDSDSHMDRFKADFVHGKGEGQIFLLHGPPGTGKTLTAESVAEYTKRPLLSITAADLGDEPVDLEKKLLDTFNCAFSWDAIVLLDEADVYLERRSTNDMKRNSIVSIFLRAFDYFQGILFLTTNRVGQFDEAFISRIHVSIGYPPLNEDARSQIWNNLFEKIKDDHRKGGQEIRVEYEAKQLVRKNEDIKALEWNGREIRNAFQTAVALAIFDSNQAQERNEPEENCIPEIKEKHLSQVVEMSKAFKQYIVDTHEGVKDTDRAYNLGNRDDRSNTEDARPMPSPRNPKPLGTK